MRCYTWHSHHENIRETSPGCNRAATATEPQMIIKLFFRQCFQLPSRQRIGLDRGTVPRYWPIDARSSRRKVHGWPATPDFVAHIFPEALPKLFDQFIRCPSTRKSRRICRQRRTRLACFREERLKYCHYTATYSSGLGWRRYTLYCWWKWFLPRDAMRCRTVSVCLFVTIK